MLYDLKMLNLGCGSRYNDSWTNIDICPCAPGVIAHDLKKPLPFESRSFDTVYSSHLLEHLPKSSVQPLLQECFRILKSGGIIRLVVPDLEQIVRIYLEVLEQSIQGDAEACKRYEWIVIELLDQMVRTRSGGEMLKYWMQNPMPAKEFVVKRVGSEALNAIKTLQEDPAKRKAAQEAAEGVDPGQVGSFRLSGEVHQWMYDRYSMKCLLEKAGFVAIKQCRADKSSIPDFNSYLLDIEANGSVRKPDSLFMEAVRPL